MLGAEKDRPKASHDVRQSIDLDVILFDYPALILKYSEKNTLVTLGIPEKKLDLGIIFSKAYYFGIVRRSEASAHRGVKDRLQQISLSLGVFTYKDINALGKLHLRTLDIAKAAELYFFAVHLLLFLHSYGKKHKLLFLSVFLVIIVYRLDIHTCKR